RLRSPSRSRVAALAYLPPLALISSSTFRRVAAGSAWALVSHILQHRKTGRPLTWILTGGPIVPSRFVVTLQNRCCSASWRSGALSLASSARALRSRASSLSGVDGLTATAALALPTPE